MCRVLYSIALVMFQKSEAAFNEWMKAKRNQMRREKHESELLKKEEEQFMHDRPRQESDKAFRQYVFKEYVIDPSNTSTLCTAFHLQLFDLTLFMF